jgi:hypothetical protein
VRRLAGECLRGRPCEGHEDLDSSNLEDRKPTRIFVCTRVKKFFFWRNATVTFKIYLPKLVYIYNILDALIGVVRVCHSRYCLGAKI